MSAASDKRRRQARRGARRHLEAQAADRGIAVRLAMPDVVVLPRASWNGVAFPAYQDPLDAIGSLFGVARRDPYAYPRAPLTTSLVDEADALLRAACEAPKPLTMREMAVAEEAMLQPRLRRHVEVLPPREYAARLAVATVLPGLGLVEPAEEAADFERDIDCLLVAARRPGEPVADRAVLRAEIVAAAQTTTLRNGYAVARLVRILREEVARTGDLAAARARLADPTGMLLADDLRPLIGGT